jgi:hypothetical protein
MGGDIGRQEMKLLHLGSPGHQLRPFEDAWVIEGADLDEDGGWGTIRARSEMDPASPAEVSSGRARAIVLIE